MVGLKRFIHKCQSISFYDGSLSRKINSSGYRAGENFGSIYTQSVR